MSADSLRPHVAGKILDPTARMIGKLGLSPNALSMISLIFSVFAGIFYYISGGNSNPHSFYCLVAAGICVLINSGLDALDGSLARQKGLSGKKGDFLDHVIDRYADVFIISGVIFAGFCEWWIGVFALTGVLLTSYLGTQAQAMEIGRYYGGIMGRADRLILILAATFLDFAYIFIYDEPFYFCRSSFLGWCMVIIAIGSHITAFQRIYHIWKALDKEEKEKDQKTRENSQKTT